MFRLAGADLNLISQLATLLARLSADRGPKRPSEARTSSVQLLCRQRGEPQADLDPGRVPEPSGISKGLLFREFQLGKCAPGSRMIQLGVGFEKLFHACRKSGPAARQGRILALAL